MYMIKHLLRWYHERKMNKEERLTYEAKLLVEFYAKHVLKLTDDEYTNYHPKQWGAWIGNARFLVETFGYDAAEEIVKYRKNLTL